MNKKYILLKLLMIFICLMLLVLLWIITYYSNYVNNSVVSISIMFIIIFLIISPCLLVYIAFYSYDYCHAKNRRVRKLKRKLVKKLSTIDNFLDANIVYLDTYSTFNRPNTEISLISYYMSHSRCDRLYDSLLADCQLCVKFKDNTTLEVDFKICFDFDEKLLYWNERYSDELTFICEVYKLCLDLKRYEICL